MLELRYDCQIALSPEGKFEAPLTKEKQTTSLNKILESLRIKRCVSHFGLPANKMAVHTEHRPMKAGVSAEFAHSGFIQIVPRSPEDCENLVKQLSSPWMKSECVWKARIAPKAVLAANYQSFEAAQGYLHSAPNGIGAMDVWAQPGGRGQGTTVCDVEFDWNLNHVDLPHGIKKIGGALTGRAGDREHGTAVLGQLVSRSGRIGTVGICHKARAMVQSAIIRGLQNIAGAITNAARRLEPGDVILIEIQIPESDGRLLPVQVSSNVFSAIRAATDRGITVVEAAGNGGENFNQATERNLRRDSGAIVVGAGVPPTNFFGFLGNEIPALEPLTRYGNIGVPRSRIYFSNYGRIVNVQGWGWNVTTLGYGDAQHGADQNERYTHRFNGTSSARHHSGRSRCLHSGSQESTWPTTSDSKTSKRYP